MRYKRQSNQTGCFKQWPKKIIMKNFIRYKEAKYAKMLVKLNM